jgi:hypothetical protein
MSREQVGFSSKIGSKSAKSFERVLAKTPRRPIAQEI